MSRYADDDLESVSTASCSDDDEIDNAAMEKMHCNFLQKQKSGYLAEIITRRASAVFAGGLSGLSSPQNNNNSNHRNSNAGSLSPRPPMSFNNVNNKLKQKLTDIREDQDHHQDHHAEEEHHQQQQQQHGGVPSGIAASMESLAGSPTNQNDNTPSSTKANGRRNRMVTISSNNNLKSANDSPQAATTTTTGPFLGVATPAISGNEASLLSSVSTATGLSIREDPDSDENNNNKNAATHEVVVPVPSSDEPASPAAGTSQNPLSSESPAEPDAVVMGVNRNNNESAAAATTTVVHTPSPPPHAPGPHAPVPHSTSQEVDELTNDLVAGRVSPVPAGPGSAARVPTPPLGDRSRSPRTSLTSNSNAMSPVFGDVPVSLAGSASGCGNVQSIISSSLKQHEANNGSITSDSALASKDNSMPNIPPPPRRLTAVPVPSPTPAAPTQPQPPSPPPHNPTTETSDQPEKREEEEKEEEAPTAPTSPALGATIPRLAQSATAIYASASAAIAAAADDDAAPNTGRSEVESRDGESRCRDPSPPDTPTIYKNDEEEEDQCGVERPTVRQLATTTSTLGSPQLSTHQNSHSHVVTWGINDSDHPNIGTRLVAPNSDMDGAKTPEVAQVSTPRLLKRCSSAASGNASPAPCSLYVSQVDDSERQVEVLPQITAENFDVAPPMTTAIGATNNNNSNNNLGSMFSLQGLLNVSRPENVSANDILKKDEPDAVKEEQTLHAPRALAPALKHRRSQPPRSASREPPETSDNNSSSNHPEAAASAADPPSPHSTADGELEEKHEPTPEELLKREKMLQERVAALKKLVPPGGSTLLGGSKSARTAMSPKPPARVVPLSAR